MILKLIIKLILKLLFFGRAAYDISSAEFKEKASVIKDKLDQAERNGNDTCDALYRRMEGLNESMENIQKKASGNGTDPVIEFNDLQAELAELRADIRELKRSLPVRGNHGNQN